VSNTGGSETTTTTTSQSTSTTTSGQAPQEREAETRLRGLLKRVRSSTIKRGLRATLTAALSGALRALAAEAGQASGLSFVDATGLSGARTALADPFARATADLAVVDVGGPRGNAAATAQPCSGLAKFIKDVKRAARRHPPQIPKRTAKGWIRTAQTVAAAAGC